MHEYVADSSLCMCLRLRPISTQMDILPLLKSTNTNCNILLLSQTNGMPLTGLNMDASSGREKTAEMYLKNE